jgi:hypothetical protein|tara:strand:+ start:1073 stop:2116 length:1044 start_codon:yes stop_codon:yes gene_type:complete
MMRIALLLLFILIAGCDEQTTPRSTGTRSLDSISLVLVGRIVDRFQKVNRDHSKNTIIASDALLVSVENFLADPGEQQLQLIKDNWYQAHNTFLAANFSLFTDQDKNVFLIDAWPIQGGFLDSLPEYPHSGIISDVALTITETSIRNQHGITDAQEVSLGFHALEFLIFSRTPDDFTISDDEVKVRRRQALALIAQLLNQDINSMLVNADRVQSGIHATLNKGNMYGVLKQLLHRSHKKVQFLFSEANSISNENTGHSRFSKSSWSNLGTQVEVLSELTNENTAMNRVFTLLDQKTSADYRQTLVQATDTLSKRKRNEENLARVTLLLAALGHQLGDLNIVLENSTP